jgi:DNA-binding HxlR family transcriptional regulator
MNDAYSRDTDPDTSLDAALSVDATRLEAIVLEVIKGFPNGCICEEIERALPYIRANSITPRIKPLMKKGFVINTGYRKPSSSGRGQRIIKAVI